jgi:hypothetical protein
MPGLARLAELIKTRNAVHQEIAALIGRPAHVGHVGEFIAAAIFHIDLEESAAHKGSDGHFAAGPLAGRSVNVKWYTHNAGLLDVNPRALPDDYLVLAGPRIAAGSSRSAVHPWVIAAVYLFEARDLVAALRARGTKLGIAASIMRPLWDAAEIWPNPRNPRWNLSTEQQEMLALFR